MDTAQTLEQKTGRKILYIYMTMFLVTFFFGITYVLLNNKIENIKKDITSGLSLAESDLENLTQVAIELESGETVYATIDEGNVSEGVLDQNIVLKTNDGRQITGYVKEIVTKIDVQDGSITEKKLSSAVVERIQRLESSVEDLEEGEDTPTVDQGDTIYVELTEGIIDTQYLADNSVTSAKIVNGSITGGKLVDGVILTNHLGIGSVTTVKLANGSVTTEKLAEGLITSSKLATGSVSTEKLVDSVITTVKLADGSVTTAKLVDGSITSGKVADGSILAIDIANGAIISGKIASGVITATELASGSVTLSKLSTSMCVADQVLKKQGDGSWACGEDVDTDTNTSNTTTAGDGLSNSGTSSDVVLDVNVDGSTISIVTNQLTIPDGAITSAKLADGSVVNAKIADSAITGIKLNDGSVATAKIVDGNVTEGKLASGAVTEVKLGNGSVTSTKISNGTILDEDISASASIAYSKLNLSGNITTSDIANATILFEDIAQNSCNTNDVMKWNGTAWVCSDDSETPDYDSGWFAVASSNTYTKAHSLGARPSRIEVWWWSTNTPASTDYVPIVQTVVDGTGTGSGKIFVSSNETNIKVQTGTSTEYGTIHHTQYSSSSGYYRIYAWK